MSNINDKSKTTNQAQMGVEFLELLRQGEEVPIQGDIAEKKVRFMAHLAFGFESTLPGEEFWAESPQTAGEFGLGKDRYDLVRLLDNLAVTVAEGHCSEVSKHDFPKDVWDFALIYYPQMNQMSPARLTAQGTELFMKQDALPFAMLSTIVTNTLDPELQELAKRVRTAVARSARYGRISQAHFLAVNGSSKWIEDAYSCFGINAEYAATLLSALANRDEKWREGAENETRENIQKYYNEPNRLTIVTNPGLATGCITFMTPTASMKFERDVRQYCEVVLTDLLKALGKLPVATTTQD